MSAFDPSKSEVGPIRALGESKKYAVVAVIVAGSLALSGAAFAQGNIALAVTALWPAAIVVSAYVLGQGHVDAAAFRSTAITAETEPKK